MNASGEDALRDYLEGFLECLDGAAIRIALVSDDHIGKIKVQSLGGREGTDEQEEGDGPILSVVWEIERAKRPLYAHCGRCGSIFEDDLPSYGSTFCPYCAPLVLRRGLTAEDIKELLDEAAD